MRRRAGATEPHILRGPERGQETAGREEGLLSPKRPLSRESVTQGGCDRDRTEPEGREVAGPDR